MSMELSFRGDELVSHCQHRIEYHQKQAVFWREQAGERIGSGLGSVSNHAVMGAQHQASNHDRKVVKFKMYAERFNPAGTYMLDVRDLYELELLENEYD